MPEQTCFASALHVEVSELGGVGTPAAAARQNSILGGQGGPPVAGLSLCLHGCTSGLGIFRIEGSSGLRFRGVKGYVGYFGFRV